MASPMSSSATTTIAIPFHGHSPEVKVSAPRKVSSAAVGGVATPTISASHPTVTIQASAPDSHRPEWSATCDAACADAVSQRCMGQAPR